MSRNRVSIDWGVLGDTQGAATLAKKLGLPYDQSQGAELKPKSRAADYIISKAKLKGLYNGHVGGKDYVKEAVAHDFKTSNRIMVSPENCFMFQQLGRSIIEEAFKTASSNHMSKNIKPYILLEGLGWGPLTTLAEHNFLKVAFYDPYAPTLASAIKAAAEKVGPENVSAITINRPKNPDSKETTREEIIDVFQTLDELNAYPNVDITAIIDIPYSYAAPQITDRYGRYLKTGFEDVLDDRWDTKWLVARSASKEVGAASIGLTFTGVSQNYPVKELTSRVAMNGKGLTNTSPKLLNNVADLLIQDQLNDIKWENRSDLREKYAENRIISENALPENIVPGGVNMLTLHEFKADDLIGHRVIGDKYGLWEIKSRHDVMEYLAHEFNVAVVGMSYSGRPGSIYIRSAQRDMPEKFGPGTEQLVKGIDNIRNTKFVPDFKPV